jgi:ribosomal-protein-alanine N-acetyltransferase
LKKAVCKKSGDMQLYCNSCGKKLKVENGILKEDAFEAKKEWGYFSDWDTQIHRFNLCEECYKRITGEFEIPVEVRTKTEVL